MRAEVKKLVSEGRTGGEIAKAVGISLPSVQNIKKALGLVGKRKK
jgi:DNA-binding CsgD family transcriptional regulator